MPLRVAIDSNVWLSGLVFSSGPPSEIVTFAFLKKFHVVSSSFILDEVERNLIKKFDVATSAARELRYRIAQVADIYEPRGIINIIHEKRSDNLILETAVLGRAQYLVTGDRKHILPLHEFHGIRIADPSSFVIILKDHQMREEKG